MAECHTCGKIVDIEATTCNHCGRPNPTKMRKGEGCASVVGIILFIVIALAMWAYVRYAPRLNSSTTPQAETTEISEPYQPLAKPSPDTGAQAYVVEPDVADDQEAAIASSQSNEYSAAAADSNPTPVFPYSAHLIDSDGKVVIQSGASMFSKNVESVTTGTHVQAASKEGKWISVQLDNGNVGFVRQRQLQFD